MMSDRLRLVALNIGRHIDLRLLGLAVFTSYLLGEVASCWVNCLGKDVPSTEIRNLWCLDF